MFIFYYDQAVRIFLMAAWEVCSRYGDSRLSGCYATAVFGHACARCIVGVSARCWISAGAEEAENGAASTRGKKRCGRVNGTMRLPMNAHFEILLRRQKNRSVDYGCVFRWPFHWTFFFKASVAIRLSRVCWHPVNSDAVLLVLAAGFHIFRVWPTWHARKSVTLMTNY